MASDDQNQRKIISRANRMLRQSQTLRKLPDELLEESKDLRPAAKDTQPKKARRATRKGPVRKRRRLEVLIGSAGAEPAELYHRAPGHRVLRTASGSGQIHTEVTRC